MAMSVVAACRSLALSTWLLSYCFVHLLCMDFTVAEKEEWYTAFVNITYHDPASGTNRTEKSECGRYGEHSLKQDAWGLAVMPPPQDRLACDPATKYPVPAYASRWVALIPIGNCTCRDKIRHAALHNASAVLIYNVGYGNDTSTMAHPGIEDIVAIMIPEPKGKEIASLIERNLNVTIYITIGTRNLQKFVSRTSVVFVSISFIVLMIISLAWLVFYYIQRFRYANARDRNQEELDEVVYVWNSHNIRKCKRQDSTGGRPILLYLYPESRDAVNRIIPVNADEVTLCKEECLPKGQYPCDETVFELCCLIMEENSWDAPEDPYSAVDLYFRLRNYILQNL